MAGTIIALSKQDLIRPYIRFMVEHDNKNWLHPLIIIVTIFVVYLNSFWGIFQFDDYNVIVYNPDIHTWNSWLNNLAHGIRPLLKFTYTLNWTSGMGIFGFHLLNISIHIINALIIYFLSVIFMYRFTGITSGRNAAFITAILWALHPVQTEAVTYICGRSTSLMCMFYLGSFWAYIHGTEGKGRLWVYLISPLFFIMAVLTKEVALTFPLVLLLWEITNHREIDFTAIIRKQAVHWMLFCIILGAFIIHSNYGRLLKYSFGIRGVGENLLSQINGVSYLITRLFMIHRLNIDPELPVISQWTLLISLEAIFLLVLIIIGMLSIKRNPWLSFGILWFFLHLIPGNSIIPRLDIANERQLYLPIWGIFLIIGVGISRFINSIHEKYIFKQVAVIMLILILGLFTAKRNFVYWSETALWEDTAIKSPMKARVYNNLGYAYALDGRIKDAKDAYVKALTLKPDYKIARNNLEKVLEK